MSQTCCRQSERQFVIAGWPRSEADSLLLAELHVERAALLRSGGATEKGSSSGGRRGGGAQQSAAVERHLAAAEANMALMQLGGLQTAEASSDPSASPSDMAAPPSEALAAVETSSPLPPPLTAEAAWQRTVRQQWLLGRIAELRRQPAGAAAAFQACRRLLADSNAVLQRIPEDGTADEQPAPGGGLPSELLSVSEDAAAEQQPPAAGPDSGAAAAAGAAATAGATPASVHLRGCAVDAIISVKAVEAKLQVCATL